MSFYEKEGLHGILRADMRAQSDLEQFYVRMMLVDFCNLFQNKKGVCRGIA